MNYADAAELEQFLKAYPDTQVLELLMPDISGILRAKRIHRSEFSRLFDGTFLTPRSAPLLGALHLIAPQLPGGCRSAHVRRDKPVGQYSYGELVGHTNRCKQPMGQ